MRQLQVAQAQTLVNVDSRKHLPVFAVVVDPELHFNRLQRRRILNGEAHQKLEYALEGVVAEDHVEESFVLRRDFRQQLNLSVVGYRLKRTHDVLYLTKQIYVARVRFKSLFETVRHDLLVA